MIHREIEEKVEEPGVRSRREPETLDEAGMDGNISFFPFLFFFLGFLIITFFLKFSHDYTFPTDIFLCYVRMTIIPMREEEGNQIPVS